jgi:hypothetical protein
MAVLQAIEGLEPSDVLEGGETSDDRATRIAKLTKQLMTVDHRREIVQEKIIDPDTPPEAVADHIRTVDELATKKAEILTELKALKEELVTGRSEMLGEVQSLLRIMRECPTEERLDLRTRVKARLKYLVEEIWIFVERITFKQRVVHTQIFLRGGRKHYLRILQRPITAKVQGVAALDLEEVDLRNYEPTQAAAGKVRRSRRGMGGMGKGM